MSENKTLNTPSGWIWTTLHEISAPIIRVNRDFQKIEEKFEYIDIESIDNINFTLKGSKSLIWKDAPSRAQQKIKADDILFANVRPYLKNIAMVPSQFDGQIASTGFCVIRPINVHPKYVFYWLISQSFVDRVNLFAKGTSYPAVTNRTILEQPILLAPLAEQNRIVAKLDEIFSELNKCSEQLQVADIQLKIYYKSLLKQAFQGKLTNTWRNEREENSNTEKLVNTINDFHERRFDTKTKQLSILKSKLANPNNTKDDKKEIPNSWLRVQLNELSEKITDGTHHTPEYVKSGVHFISVKDIYDGNIHFDNTKFIDLSSHNELIKRCNPEKGDVVLTKSGTIGRVAVVPESPIFSLFVSVALIKPHTELIDSKYLCYAIEDYINSIDIKHDIKGGVIKNFHLEDIRLAKIPYCELSEQLEIVSELENKFSIAKKSEKIISASLSQATTLKQSFLQQAFNGSLTQRSKSDLPASNDLKQIIKEKAKLLIVDSERKQKTRSSNVKTKKMAKDLKEILEILKDASEPVASNELWTNSIYKDDIDGFYAQMKLLYDNNEIIEERKGKLSYVKLNIIT